MHDAMKCMLLMDGQRLHFKKQNKKKREASQARSAMAGDDVPGDWISVYFPVAQTLACMAGIIQRIAESLTVCLSWNRELKRP